jgi:glycosyltransferase involved in cell wall biosynthesis
LIRNWPAKVFTRSAAHVFFQGGENRKYWLARGATPERMSWIPCVSDSQVFRRPAFATELERSAFRAANNAGAGDVVFVVSGKLEPRKRPADAIEAFARCEVGNARLWFLGSGPLQEELCALAKSRTVEKKITWFGFRNQNELPTVLQAADVLLHPSEQDPWPYSVLEGAVSGLALLLSNRVGSYPDWQEPPSPAIVFGCGDIGELVDAIKSLALDHTKLTEVRRAAKAKSSRYTEQEFSERFESAVFKLMNTRVAVVDSHPIQYHFPYFKLLGCDSQIASHVFYCWDTRAGVQDPSYGRVQWDLPLLEGYVHSFLPNWAKQPGPEFWGQMNPALIRVLWRGNYDAVWIWGYSTASAWIAALAAKSMGIKVMFRGEATLVQPRSFFKRITKALVVRCFLKLVDVVAYSCSANREYFEHYGVREDRLLFVPCAVDNTRFQSEARRLDRRKARALLGLKDNAKVVLSVGQLIPRKRPLDIIQALETLQDQFSITLVMVGDGPLRQSLEGYCQSKKLDNIRFDGFKNQTELAAYYSAADIFLLTSEYDPSPKALNEAMNFHLPVVVSDNVGTVDDLVRDGHNGFIVACSDVQAIAGACKRIFQSPEIANAMGQRSAEMIEEWTFENGHRKIKAWLHGESGRRKSR